MRLSERKRQYWGRNLRMTACLLAVWFIVTFVMSYFAKELGRMSILGFPLSFYMSAQGSLVAYVAIVWYYARYMNRLDKEYGVHEGEE